MIKLRFAWPPWKKAAPKQEPRVLHVPAEHCLTVRTLWDAYCMQEGAGGGAAARYELWKFIAEVVPEVSEGKFLFSLDFSPSRQVILRENFDNPRKEF